MRSYKMKYRLLDEETLGHMIDFLDNIQIEAAKGKYIITIDDDCFLKPSSVKVMIDVFEKNQNLAIIGFGLRNPEGGPEESDYWMTTDNNILTRDYSCSYQTMNYGSASGFRKEAIEKVNYIDPLWSWSAGGGDNELNFSVISMGYNTELIPELKMVQQSRTNKSVSSTSERDVPRLEMCFAIPVNV